VSYEPGYVTVSVTDSGHGPIAVTVGQQAEQVSAPSQNGTNGGRVGKATVGPGRSGGFAVTAKLPTP
jgi:hypothetical protein